MTTLHGIAPAMAEVMVYSVIQGTLLGLLVYLVLRLVPRKNSGTRFTVWFSTLLAVIIVPFLSLTSLEAGTISVAGSASQYGLFILPASLAAWAFLGWALIALVGLLRVAVGFWQALRLRKSCVPIDPAILNPEAHEIVEQFRGSRLVLIGTSAKLDVPTAVGFWKPAVLLPSWLVAEASADELKHVLLHELAHLRRRDDWTNLVQKVVKALLFFHPLVWWIENRLSLERELACDDAVLAQTESPRVYAQCLARLAEKSFLRRQIALAQAAVSRMHQLSNRVTQILDAQRPRTTQLWKPAIPLVAGFALLCGVSLRHAPMLVSFTEGAERPVMAANPASATPITGTTPIATTTATPIALKSGSGMGDRHLRVPQGMGPQLINAAFKPGNNQQHSISRPQHPRSGKDTKHLRGTRAIHQAPAPHPPTLLLASYSGYVVAHEEFVVTMISQGIQPGQWQLQVWQLRVLVPASETEKPTPRKT